MFGPINRLAFSFLFLLFLTSSVYGQVIYPNPVGHVNDFANVIDAVAERELESGLRDYRKKTSIEIAVVTVESTNGLEAPEYALNLFQKWGIGDREKDNGILILVAPSERDMKIEVGYGMEPDLTDAQAGRIIRNVILPFFIEDQMEAGIIAGVNAVLDQLGATPFETRLEERRIAEEKRQIEEQRQAAQNAVFMTFLGIGLMVLCAICTPIFLVRRKILRERRLKTQYQNNARALNECVLIIKNSEVNYPNAQKNLDELKKDNPEAVWANFEESIGKIPERIRQARIELDNLITLNNNENGWKKSQETFSEVSVLFAKITELAGYPQTIRETIIQVRDSKNKSPELLKKTLFDIEATRESLNHKDVSNNAKQHLKDAEDKCTEANSLMSSQELVNWIAVNTLITGAIALVSKAKNAAISDKNSAEEARRPKPVYISSTSRSHRSSGSSGSRSGGFGGFGGGRSGGGGARGKW
ncbi:MAG: TPM domain-containing protein [bacterium]|nr:TPM domain-containing protein [bacterium]